MRWWMSMIARCRNENGRKEVGRSSGPWIVELRTSFDLERERRLLGRCVLVQVRGDAVLDGRAGAW